MKKLNVLTALVVLASTCSIAYGATGSFSSVTGPVKSGNVAVYVIHGQDKIKGQEILTLQEALAGKKVVVKETGNVNELTIQNVSDEIVFVQAGEIVKGGRQDRTIQYDMMLPPKSQAIPLPSFCVEHGRWSGRAGEADGHFASSNSMVAGKAMKAAVQGAVAALPAPILRDFRSASPQQAVWQSVDFMQQKLSENAGGSVNSSASPSSMQLTLEHKRVKDATASLVRDLKNVSADSDAIGYAVAINGKVASADVYASHKLFSKLWPKLLDSSAAEAVAEQKSGPVAAAPAVGTIERFLLNADKSVAKPKVATKDSRMEERESSDAYRYSCYFNSPRRVSVSDQRPEAPMPIHDSFLAK